jgi:uncharacterized protein
LAHLSAMRLKRFGVQAVGGTALGFLLSRAGLSDWTELNRMLGLEDARLYYVFCSAVALSMVLWWLLGRWGVVLRPRPLHAGSIPGGLIFGVGWAVCGACPAVAILQLGEGKMLAAFTCLGITLGDFLCKIAQEKLLRFEVPSCSE